MTELPDRFRLGVWPTPLHRLDRLADALDAPPLLVKRDDLSGFAFAGTKARALEQLVGDARSRGCDVLVVGGGPSSNLVAATAAAAQAAGMRCVAVLYGRPAPERRHANLALTRWSNAHVRYTGDDDRASVDEALPVVSAELAAEGARPYEIPRGGATPIGALGSALAIAEVSRQLTECDVRPSHLVVACGSGGIHAGLLAGTHAAGDPWQVVGMSVSRSPEEVTARVAELAADCATLLGTDPPPPSAVVLRDVRGDGFGVASPEGRSAATLAATTEGLLLDPVYTAKAWSGLPGLIADGVDGGVLLWHTGGVAGFLDDVFTADADTRG